MSDTIPQDGIPHKQCKVCKEWFPATPQYFNRDKGKKYDVRNQCIDCRHKARRKTPLPEPCPEGYQRCTQCKEVFPATKQYFFAHSAAKDGLRSECKICTMCHAQWYYAQPSVIAAEKARHQTETFRIGARIARKKYRKRHPEKIRNYHRLEKTRRRKIKGKLTVKDIENQFQRQKGKCYYCSNKFGKGRNAYHIDHILPVTRGGTNHPDNIVLACPSCNMHKHNRMPHEWPEGGRLL